MVQVVAIEGYPTAPPEQPEQPLVYLSDGTLAAEDMSVLLQNEDGFMKGVLRCLGGAIEVRPHNDMFHKPLGGREPVIVPLAALEGETPAARLFRCSG